MSPAINPRSLAAFAAGAVATLVGTLTIELVSVEAAPGDSDATFVPITPCRLIDTRPAPRRVGSGGSIGADETRTIVAHGTNGNCTLPADAVGLSLNVTAVRPTEPTFLTFWPDGALPDASNLNPVPGQPPTPNSVTTELSGSGSFRLYNLAGSVNVIVDVNGYYTAASLQDLDTRLTGLDARLEALEDLTASMSIEQVDGYPVIRFTGVNVQVVSGSGTTFSAVNGTGNLIVGYHESGTGDLRTGSHNLVVGPHHSYNSFGGFVTGDDNTIAASYASVSGGFLNTANGIAASVSGGTDNNASGTYASVSGGQFNIASGDKASVVGGAENTASGSWGAVLGGGLNTAGESDSVIGGDNVACDLQGANAVVCDDVNQVFD